MKHNTRGFSLIEVMVTLPLVALLFGGTIALFSESQRMAQRTSTAVQATQDSATGLQAVLGATREAINFSLPPDTTNVNTNGMTFLPPDGNVADYQTSTKPPINTAVELLMPSGATSVKITGQPATPGLNLLDRNGNALVTGGYDRTQPEIVNGMPVNPLLGDILCIYRGDAAGNAAPNNGQFLWSVRRPAPAGLYDPSYDVHRKLCRLILSKHADGNPATEAVQFIGRHTSLASGNVDIPASMPYELEFKLICGAQTALQGTQTNEATDGTNISSLSAKCSLLRNHN